MDFLLALISLAVITLGFILIFSKKGAWFLYKNRVNNTPEPSASFYKIARIRGIITVIIGIALLAFHIVHIF